MVISVLCIAEGYLLLLCINCVVAYKWYEFFVVSLVITAYWNGIMGISKLNASLPRSRRVPRVYPSKRWTVGWTSRCF